MGFFSKLKEGLKKTRESVVGQINTMLSTYTTVDEELFEDLEELLVMGDVGMDTANLICGKLRVRVKEKRITDPQKIMDEIAEISAEILSENNEMVLGTKPSVILVIGVNGVGKTTSIGKIANYYVQMAIAFRITSFHSPRITPYAHKAIARARRT
ncbi:MAG: signal recognition particle receptor subunit alpha [Ruminococcus sp.]|nr:signal recognition particle receptor subunit alpha [Ruminococcus sp.]